MGTIVSLPVEQRKLLVSNLRGPQRDQLLTEFSPDQRELFLAMNGPTGVVTGELQQAKLWRAIYSERQLQEVMTDFWVNHFNVFLNKDADQYYLTSYERDVIRPRALGKFKDLLLATAQSPAMLFYLDNWASIGPNSPAANPPGRNAPPKPGQQPGLNENYGRELLELHTLGVDGGYTQKDVTEAVRIFTGWTIDHPELGGNFVFDPRKHEPGPKVVLGTRFEGGGQDEGLRLLDMLARHPATAKFVCSKIARRFVADDPPPALVQQMAQTYQTKDGDIREILRTMFRSKEFWVLQVYRAKVKTPLEFIASAVRATGASVDNPGPLLGTLNKMGMPLYGQQPPTGYPMLAQAWMNSDQLVDRLNFALQMTQGQIGGVKFDSQRVLALGVLANTRVPHGNLPPSSPISGPRQALALLEDALLNGDVLPQTQAAIEKELQDPQLTGKILADPSAPLGRMTALILGSPDFQRR